MSTNKKIIRKAMHLLITFILLLGSCASSKINDNVFGMKPIHEFSSAPLIGVTYDSNNRPCINAEISFLIEDEEAVKTAYMTVKSDINGRFMIPDLRRGEHEILVKKEGFEDGRILLDFSDATLVLYIKLYSLKSLLDSAEKNLDKHDFTEAEAYLARALKVDSHSIEALYLQAVLLTLQNRTADAQEVINLIKELNPDFQIYYNET